MNATVRHPRTIQIFLPTGDPTGLRIAEQTTSIMRVIEVPRRDLDQFLAMDEAAQVGLYFLVGGTDRDEIYIGQSNNVGSRIQQHHKEDKKDWERALVLVSLTQNLTQTHALYLEYRFIETAKAYNRVRLINGNKGQQPHTPPPLKADCEQIHEICALLLATLGYPFFEPLLKPTARPEAAAKDGQTREDAIFTLPRNGVDARAIYTNEGMVVLKDSSFPYIAQTGTTPTYRISLIEKCDELLQKGVLKKEGGRCVFAQNHLFPTPSTAASLLILGSANGWTEFKTAEGITLKDHQDRSSD